MCTQTFSWIRERFCLQVAPLDSVFRCAMPVLYQMHHRSPWPVWPAPGRSGDEFGHVFLLKDGWCLLSHWSCAAIRLDVIMVPDNVFLMCSWFLSWSIWVRNFRGWTHKQNREVVHEMRLHILFILIQISELELFDIICSIKLLMKYVFFVLKQFPHNFSVYDLWRLQWS